MNFDEYLDRNEFPTMKWSNSFLFEHFGNDEAIPMSVADMDLKAPPVVIEKLQKRVMHGIYGYESKPESCNIALMNWYQNRYRWKIDAQHIEVCPSILNAISLLINQHFNEGDGVSFSPQYFLNSGW